MKKHFLFSFLICMISLQIHAQINRIAGPASINAGLDGWNTENSNGTFTLAIEGDAVKVVAIDATTSLTGKFHQRFTPSFNGEYTLTFKAKKDGTGDQKISINLLRIDQWTDLTTPQSQVIIDTEEFKEYTVTFNYNEDVKARTPHGLQLEIYLNGVYGNLWFEDIAIYENSNNLIAYYDDFEENRSYEVGLENTNNWDKFMQEEELGRIEVDGNTVLEYKNNTSYEVPWGNSIYRKWWALKGEQYRLQFDISATVAIAEEMGIGVEIWLNGGNVIRDVTFFPVTTAMETIHMITREVATAGSYTPLFYVGKLPVGESLYIDNVIISPIHLYNAEVGSATSDKLEISWLHSGYIAGDKLDIYLIDGENENIISEDIEVIEGSVTLKLESLLEADKMYTVRLIDKVGEGEYSVTNETESNAFSPAEEPGNEIVISEYGYATFCSPQHGQISGNVKIYYASKIEGEVVILKLIENGIIPANEGVILKGEEGSYPFVYVDESITIDDNLLVGTSIPTEITDGYYLSYSVEGEVGFARVADVPEDKKMIDAWKAYLNVSSTNASRLSMKFDDDTTGIDNSEVERSGSVDVYGIDGRVVRRNVAYENAVSGLSKGIYIVDGEKIIVK